MLINQIAVFLENKTGSLDSLVNTISNAQINMYSLNIADTSDFGIVRLITDNNDKALSVIKTAGFTASSVDLVAVEVDNVPGQLSSVLDKLSKAGISLEYIYSYSKSDNKNLILLKTSDVNETQKILNE